jgi:hypothetical protein
LKASATEIIGYCRVKHHTPWFHDECTKLLNQRKQAKLQCLQNPGQTNGGNLNNVRCETTRTFRNKKREYPEEKLISLKQTEQIYQRCFRGINKFKKGFEPRTNLVKDENGDLSDFHNILKRWKNYFC